MIDDSSSRPGRVVLLPRIVLCFGPFRFDMTARRLHRGDAEVHLVPKAAAALELLLAHHGRTVSKEEFFDTVWEGVHVSDESLTQTISTIRQALGDSAQSPAFIQTVSGKGYRFIGRLSGRPGDSVVTTPHPAAEGSGRRAGVDVPQPAVPAPSAPTSHETTTARQDSGPPPSGLSVLGHGVLPWAFAAASLALAFGVWLQPSDLTVSAPPPRVLRFTAQLAPGNRLFVGEETHRRWGAVPNTLALSAGGEYLAYVARGEDSPWRLYVRPLDTSDSEARAIPGSEGAQSPFFSPDGKWLGFISGGWLHLAPVEGGLPQRVCEAVNMGASWGPDDTIVYDLGYWEGLGITTPTGTPRVLTTLNFERRENAHLDPVFLPGGTSVLYTLWPGDAGGGRDVDALGAANVETGETRPVLERASGGRYVSPGYLLFVREGQLQAQAFDIATLEVSGSPISFYETERGLFSVSAKGDLAYVHKPRTSIGSDVVWVDTAGNITQSISAEHMASQVSVSPDGGQVAAALVEPSGQQDIWILAANSSARAVQVTFDGVAALPSWSPDGEWAIYKSTKNGPWETFRVPADGTGEAEILIEGESSQWLSWHPREPHVVFGRDGDVWILDLDGAEGPRPLIEEQAGQYAARFSPDGSWLAYTSNEEGHAEVFVRSYPDLARKHKISANGGTFPHWAPGGDQIYYSDAARMMAVAIDRNAGFSPSEPVPLFSLGERFSRPTGGGDYDVAPDGQFVMIKAIDEPEHTEIEVVLNWVERLAELIPTGGSGAGR